MPLFANFGICQTFFVVLPESLDTRRAFVLVAPVVSPGSLDSGRHIVPVAISHGFQSKQLEGKLAQRLQQRMNECERTVSGFLMKALVTPICHSSLAIPVSVRIFSQPDFASPLQI
jgi:hypothetical protein